MNSIEKATQLEAELKALTQELVASLLPLRPSKKVVEKSSSWLTDLLERASSIEEPKPVAKFDTLRDQSSETATPVATANAPENIARSGPPREAVHAMPRVAPPAGPNPFVRFHAPRDQSSETATPAATTNQSSQTATPVATANAPESIARSAPPREAVHAMPRVAPPAGPNSFVGFDAPRDQSSETATPTATTNAPESIARSAPPREAMPGTPAVAPMYQPATQRHSMTQSVESTTPSTMQERRVSRLDELNGLLKKLRSDSLSVKASALISEDGLIIAQSAALGADDAPVAGISDALINFSKRGAFQLNRIKAQEVIMRGELGYGIVMNAGRGVLLVALTNEKRELGLVVFDMRELIRVILKVL